MHNRKINKFAAFVTSGLAGQHIGMWTVTEREEPGVGLEVGFLFLGIFSRNDKINVFSSGSA